MAITQVLNPSEKEVDDKSAEIVERMAKAYSTRGRTYKTDEEDFVIPKISHSEALQALQTL